MVRLKTASVLLSLLLCTVYSSSKAQSKDIAGGISVGINIPAGSFSSTHIVGVSVGYSHRRYVFGTTGKKNLTFTYNGGFAYYFWKKETVSIYQYKYPGYIFIHGFSGAIYNPIKNGTIALTAGPALRIYNGNTQFNIGSQLEFNYCINNKVAIGPEIILMKELGADLLWSTALKATFSL